MSPSFKCLDPYRKSGHALAKCEDLLGEAELEHVLGGGGPLGGGYGSGGGSGSAGGLASQLFGMR
jgi:hypothetical protein